MQYYFCGVYFIIAMHFLILYAIFRCCFHQNFTSLIYLFFHVGHVMYDTELENKNCLVNIRGLRSPYSNYFLSIIPIMV